MWSHINSVFSTSVWVFNSGTKGVIIKKTPKECIKKLQEYDIVCVVFCYMYNLRFPQHGTEDSTCGI
jgi:hypothetical protein